MSIDEEWVHHQFKNAKPIIIQEDVIQALLLTWVDLDVDHDTAEDTLSAFKSLALGHSILPEDADELWVKATWTTVSIGDTVRVLHNAYTGDAGRIHNGRRGRIVGLSARDIIVRSTDDIKPFLDAVHYRAEDLERKIKQ